MPGEIARRRPSWRGTFRIRTAWSRSSRSSTGVSRTMDFQPTEEQLLVQRTARDYADRTLIPKAAKRDESGEFPSKELGELGKLGLLGVNVPDDYGGAGAGALAYSLALQELARGDASVAVTVSV